MLHLWLLSSDPSRPSASRRDVMNGGRPRVSLPGPGEIFSPGYPLMARPWPGRSPWARRDPAGGHRRRRCRSHRCCSIRGRGRKRHVSSSCDDSTPLSLRGDAELQGFLGKIQEQRDLGRNAYSSIACEPLITTRAFCLALQIVARTSRMPVGRNRMRGTLGRRIRVEKMGIAAGGS